MKVSDFNNTDIDGDEFEGLDASIDKKNLSFLFDIVSKQMYNRPIPSIVREITSNCFDSHIEAKVNDPVILKLATDEGGYFISFTDVGVGMSPERMKKTYSKWFSSTKRDTNDQIGMFGLGSKSPLAYADSFFLSTVFDKKRYEYTIHKGQKTPRIDLIIEDDSEERNQTEVKIYIKDWYDVTQFSSACKTELVYFDNVYIDSKTIKFNNQYTIIDHKTFKYREDYQYSRELHIIIGKVPYPINWEELKIERIELPFGLKFEIGELQVTPSRESLRYVEIVGKDGTILATKDIIIAKIEEFKQELQAIYAKNQDNIFENYSDFIEYRESKYTYLNIGINKIDVTKFVTKLPAIFLPLVGFKGKLPSNLFLEYESYWCYHNKLKSREYIRNIDHQTLSDDLCVMISKIGKYNTKKNAYLFDQAKSMVNADRFFTIRNNKNYNAKELIRILHLRVNSKLYNYEETNLVKQYKMFRDYADSELARLTLDYDSLEIPIDWLTKYNLEHKRTADKGQDEILVYNYGKYTISEGREYVKPELLTDFTGFIIYGFDKHEELLKNYRTILIYSKYGFNQTEIHPKRCRLYKIAQRNEKYFVNLKNAIFIEDFMSNNKIFKKFATAAMIDSNNKSLNMTGHPHTSSRASVMNFREAMNVIFPPVAETIKDLKDACEDFGQIAYNEAKLSSNSTLDGFLEDMINIAKEYDLYDKEMYEAYQKLERYVEGLELINHIVISGQIIHLLVDFLIRKGKKVDTIWTTPLEYEKEIIKNSLEKLQYYSSIYTDKYVYLGYYVHKDGQITVNTRYASTPICQGETTLSLDTVNQNKTILQNSLVTYKAIIKYHEYQQAKTN